MHGLHKSIYPKIFSFLLIVSLGAASTSIAFADGSDIMLMDYEYVTTNKQEEYQGFNKDIEDNGELFNLKDISYEVVKVEPVVEVVEMQMIVDTEVMLSTSEYTPPNEITEDDVNYKLINCSVLEGSEYTKSYTSNVKCLQGADVANNTNLYVTSDDGQQLELNANLVKSEVLADGEWIENSIEITFERYDTGVYEWQGQTINDDSNNPLAGYEDELLASVSADAESYRVTSTSWSGEPYEKNGVMCRDAVANVERFVPYVNHTYSANLSYLRYQSQYVGQKEVNSTTDFNYTIKAIATYEEEPISVGEIVVACIGVVIIAALVVSILWILAKRKKCNEEEKNTKNFKLRKLKENGGI